MLSAWGRRPMSAELLVGNCVLITFDAILAGVRNHGLAKYSTLCIGPLNLNFRFGSLADICSAKSHFCFSPNSRHMRRSNVCPLCAKRQHYYRWLA
jgi:hypothetical protein